jgi:Mg-chelatase subunit ChlD
MSKTKTTTVVDTDDLSYSSYWLDDSVGGLDDVKLTDDENSLARIAKFAAVRRAVSNFVRILTNDSSIQVKYSAGKDSYTDGKTVVIAADDNVKNFDSMVGLALHEGSHCLLSDFEFLKTLNGDNYMFYRALHPTLRKMVVVDWSNTEEATARLTTLRTYLHTLMNVIEDRRIDSFVYKMAPGYRPYYDAMYKKYFFNSDVEKNLRYNPEWRKPTVENYVNWILMLFSPHFSPKALPGLQKMVNLIDLANIRRFDSPRMKYVHEWSVDHTDSITMGLYAAPAFSHEQFPLLWTVANELMISILKYAKLNASNTNEPNEIDIVFDMDGDEGKDMQSDLENLDIPPMETGRFNEAKAKKALDKMKDVMNQKSKKKKLTRNQEKQITSMEDASAEMTESSDAIMGKIPCLVTRKLTRDIMVATWFPFSHVDAWQGSKLAEDRNAKAGVIDGIRMGQILAHRLQVRNDPQVTHFTRQDHGKIDRRILAQLGMDIQQVFKRTTVDSYNPVMLHLSLDASGSMGGNKWRKVMAVATALAYVADKIRNLDVVITIRGNSNEGIPMVSIVHDSRKNSFTNAKTLFPYLCTSGSTPEGLCFTATLDLIKECTATHRVFFINFSDGEPGCSYKHNNQYVNYGGDIAMRQTRNVVNSMREAGVRIMSYFITDSSYHHTQHVYGGSRKTFSNMYGTDAEFVDVRNVTQVIKTLNKLLLVRE